MNSFPLRAMIGSALILSLLSGCGSPPDNRVVIKGKLIDGSKPFVLDQSKLKLPPGATSLPPGSNPVLVIFVPVESGDTVQTPVATDSGTFEVKGTDGKGIKPGKYKIAVTAGVGVTDYFGGKFSPDKTQIIRDVKPGEEIVIDVSKPTG